SRRHSMSAEEIIMERLFDELARTLAQGTSRKGFLRLVGAGMASLILARAESAEARSKKGGSCPPGETACPASPPSDRRPASEKRSKGGGTACTNLNSDPNNCGACGTKCAAGQNCGGGKCC